MNKAPIVYMPDMFSSYADEMFKHFWKKLPWEKRPDAPRRECWMNDYNIPYSYGSGEYARTYEAMPEWDFVVEMVRRVLNGVFAANFDCCFVNGYEHGRQHLGWHADDSPEMDMDHPIAVVSFGAAREIWFREAIAINDTSNKLVYAEPKIQLLANGSTLLMNAGMQKNWQHRIPKSPLGEACGPRVSLTYRKLVV